MYGIFYKISMKVVKSENIKKIMAYLEEKTRKRRENQEHEEKTRIQKNSLNQVKSVK